MASLAIVIALCCSPAFAQTPTSPRPDTTARGLAEDWSILKRDLTFLHPGLNRYNTPAQMEKHWEELRRAWSKDQDLQEAYLALSLFLAKIKCGHTYPNFFNQNKRVTQTLFQQKDKGPFYFCWLDSRMIVTRDLTPDGTLPVGTEVRTINSVPVRAILKKLLPAVRSDGSNDGKRIANLEVTGTDTHEGFDVLYPLFYPLKAPRFVLEVTRPGQSRAAIVLAEALDHAQRNALIPPASQTPESDTAPLWQLTYLKPDVAYLEMKTWELYNSKWDWQTALNATFDELSRREIPNLVIDLRANEGGNSVGDVILQRLPTRGIVREAVKRRTAYRKVPDDLRPHLSTWDKSFYDWGDAVRPVGSGFEFTNVDTDFDGTIQPSANPFRGKVFVLVGPVNSSATFNFAQQIKAYKLGTLIGRRTGGNQRGINGGAFINVKLPHSQIEVDIPLIATFPLGNRPDAGIIPDVLIRRTSRDIAQNRDAELERALALISAQGRKANL